MPGHATAAASLGPFRFESELELPELLPDQGDAGTRRRVSVRLGGVPPALSGAVRLGSIGEVTADDYLIRFETGRFLVRGGREVRVEPAAGVAASDLRAYLYGHIFAVLCHQNGLLPLHASAVERGGRAVALLGASGRGKSTLATVLARRGSSLVADDVCVLDFSGSGPRLIPVDRWVKLWRQTLEHLGEAPAALERTYSSDDKYRLYPAPAPRPGRALTVAAAIVLDALGGDDWAAGAAPGLERLPAPAAVAALLDNVFLSYALEAAGWMDRCFRQCARLAAGTAVLELRRAPGLEHLPATAAGIEAALWGAQPRSISPSASS
jgi:hypothetical protein